MRLYRHIYVLVSEHLIFTRIIVLINLYFRASFAQEAFGQAVVLAMLRFASHTATELRVTEPVPVTAELVVEVVAHAVLTVLALAQ
jgi:uncharacterized membrane protein YqhA